MTDLYDVSSDPYIDDTSGILRNKFSISNQQELDDIESDITSLEIVGIAVNGLPIDDGFNLESYQAIHKQLFTDIYDWAGEIRVMNIAKDSTKFCEYSFIPNEGTRVFRELYEDGDLKNTESKDLFVERLAYYYSEINMLHPFREGNGRTLRTFISALAASKDYLIAWDRMNPLENIEACAYAAWHDESKIIQMLTNLLD